ncbi:MAG: flagellar motor switch protein FliG [Acidobacteriota bacterium]
MAEKNVVTQTALQAGLANQIGGIDKAASLLLLLGEEISAEVFKRLNDEEVTLVSQAISKLGVIDQGMHSYIVEESYQELVNGRIKMRGDMDYARRLIQSARSGEAGAELIRNLATGALSTSDAIKALRRSDPHQLVNVIQDEHPQTVAVILAHLDPQAAAKAIELLPESGRSEICVRLATLDRLSQPVRDQVTDIVASKLSVGPDNRTGGPRRVAECFNQMSRDISRETLQQIENENPNLALSIRNLMFVFDDILLIGDADMQRIIQRLDKKILVRALKGCAEELKDQFLRNMSRRAAEMLEEDMEFLGPVKKKDAEDARKEIVAIIRQMEADEEISLGQAGAEQYVQ